MSYQNVLSERSKQKKNKETQRNLNSSWLWNWWAGYSGEGLNACGLLPLGRRRKKEVCVKVLWKDSRCGQWGGAVAGVEWLWNSGLYRRMRDCMHARLSLATNTKDHAPGDPAHHRLRAAHRRSFPLPSLRDNPLRSTGILGVCYYSLRAQGCAGFHRGIKDNWSGGTRRNLPTSLRRLLEELGVFSREPEGPLGAAGRSVWI